MPAPVLDPVEARPVRRERLRVRDRLARDRVRVEVVVEVHAVDVVVLDAVQDRGRDVLLGLGQARVEVQLAAVRPHPLRVLPRRVLGHELGRVRLHRHAVRVVPGVDLEVALVALLDDEPERVVARVLALDAREVLRPRLVRARPERVRRRAHLDEHGVETEVARDVEPVQQLGLLLLGREPGRRRPVDVDDARDPHRAQLALAGRRGRAARGERRAAGRGEGRRGRERADRDGERARRDAGRREGEELPSSDPGRRRGGGRGGAVERHC